MDLLKPSQGTHSVNVAGHLAWFHCLAQIPKHGFLVSASSTRANGFIVSYIKPNFKKAHHEVAQCGHDHLSRYLKTQYDADCHFIRVQQQCKCQWCAINQLVGWPVSSAVSQ